MLAIRSPRMVVVAITSKGSDGVGVGAPSVVVSASVTVTGEMVVETVSPSSEPHAVASIAKITNADKLRCHRDIRVPLFLSCSTETE